jgi:phosphatidylserine/phosphatidylglycerophosphate/cardiolipin synthase-like enzyme
VHDLHRLSLLVRKPHQAAEVAASQHQPAVQDAPHQELLVVDGLIAFKGSANLTNTGLRKADRGLDISEVVTDYKQVTSLNNKYFAPVWKRITVGNSDKLLIDGVPF